MSKRYIQPRVYGLRDCVCVCLCRVSSVKFFENQRCWHTEHSSGLRLSHQLIWTLLSANHSPFEVRTKQTGKRNAFLTFFLQANLSVFASASSRSFLEQSGVIFSFLPHMLFGQT